MTDITPKQSERLLELTGHTDNLDEALDQWIMEREALAQMHGDNQFLDKINSKLEAILLLTEKLVSGLQKAGGMFMPPALAKIVEEFEKLVRDYNKLCHRFVEFKDGKATDEVTE